MSKVKKDHIYRNNAKTLKNKVKTMFNNIKYADTMFLVNDQIYHASSHLVSVASTPLETIINTHFEICGEREIKIRNIKFTESFNIILKCIYGIEINLTKMNAAVLYEVFCLSESYELVEFATEIKTYLTKLEEFTVDSIVALLNIAKKLNMKELYEKLTIFAYKNTKNIVKDVSFQDIHYDVLIDLLPSDRFYAKEIDILRGVLTWHTDMYNEANGIKKDKIVARNVNSVTEAGNVNSVPSKSEDGNVVSEKERNSDQQKEVSFAETLDRTNYNDEASNVDNITKASNVINFTVARIVNSDSGKAEDGGNFVISEKERNSDKKTVVSLLKLIDLAHINNSRENISEEIDNRDIVKIEGNSDQKTEVSIGEIEVAIGETVDTGNGNYGKEEINVLSMANIDITTDSSNCSRENNSKEIDVLSMANMDEFDDYINDKNGKEDIDLLSIANIETKIDLNLVKTFSDNILKSLLSHIRISQISMMDLNATLELELFKKYKTYFSTNNLFSLTLNPRYEQTPEQCVVDISKPFKDLFLICDLKKENLYTLCDISKTFTVSIEDRFYCQTSKEEYFILKDLKLQVEILNCIFHVGDTANLKIHLICSSKSQRNWQCTGDCQVTLLSQSSGCQNIVLNRTVTFSSTSFPESFRFVWSWQNKQAYSFSMDNLVKSVIIEVKFKSLEIKLV